MKTSALVASLLVASEARLSITPNQVGQLARGLFEGALHTEHLDDYVTCTIVDGQQVVGDFEDAIAQFKTKSISGITNGLTDLSNAFLKMVEAVKLCDQPKDIQELENLEKMIMSFKDPKVFIAHVGKDIWVNGVDIFNHIKTGVADYEASKYEDFGKEMGDALAEVLLGTIELKRTGQYDDETIDPKLLEAIQIIVGVLKGAVEAEGLDNIENCVKDSGDIVVDVYDAVMDFTKGDEKDVLNGIEELGKAVLEIKPLVEDCEGVAADWAKLVKMGAIFSNPASFAYHVGKDLIVNGVQIFKEVDDSIHQFEAKNYEKFGEDIGMALAKLILGDGDIMQREYERMSPADYWKIPEEQVVWNLN